MPDKGAAVIADIFDAALDPGGLERLAVSLMKVGGGASANIIILHDNAPDEAVTHGLPDEALQRYAAYYARINPAIPATHSWDRTRIGRYSDALTTRQFRRTEFYTDFARVFDTVHVMGMPQLSIGAGSIAQIGVHRGERCRDFTDHDVERLQSIVPYLQRALQLRQTLAPRVQTDVGLAVLETLAFGCVICDGAGRVLFANRAAEALELAGMITLAAGRRGVGAPDPSEHRQLVTLIRDAAVGGSGGAMVLNAVPGARAFVLATLLPARLGGQPGQVLLTFRSEAASPAVDAALLRRLFQLTPAEARLALALAGGRSLAELGVAHRVTENTLRTQLAGVLRKTDVANQRELVRVLNLMPPVRPLAVPE